jgi:serine protease Do
LPKADSGWRLAPFVVLVVGLTGACDRPLDAVSALVIATGPTPSRAAGDRATVTPRSEAPREARALSDAFANAAQAIRPSVVRLDVEMRRRQPERDDQAAELLRRFFGLEGLPTPKPGLARGTGSGVIFDGAGHILTTSHVIRGASKMTIRLVDGRSFPGKVVGTDPLMDVGIVAFESAPPGLVKARLGNSDGLRAGDWTIAVGSPLGMDQTVSAGIVGSVGDTKSELWYGSGEPVHRYIQTDAKVNPGNSGGPLVNLDGEVIGINRVINIGPGGGYGIAIPINEAARTATILIKEGHVRYPFIGAIVVDVASAREDVPRAMRERLPETGALVVAVTPHGPAADGGMRPGDVITKIGVHEVEGAGDVGTAISGQRIGDTVSLEFLRDGGRRTLRVRIAELTSEEPPDEVAERRIGVRLQTLTESMARVLGVDPRVRGAAITEVEPGGAADRAGLVPGDVIREIDQQPVASSDEAVTALRRGAARGTSLLRITSASGTRLVKVALGGAGESKR